ncbi:Protein of unknown function [Loktanella atrilutea]|uniref:DUF3800 domain-containing protein n=1 Tax=Loktanella atrilutea TaxID=366533 RepID=A0A1M5DIE0_LOKAT|nr:DUF3800 domain-containing protein [Loktanella atrilutea]SHF66743.1 Protein of unknown function [Loktanella atrilutea]
MNDYTPPDTPIQDFSIFADESGISNDRHMIVGATVVQRLYVNALYRAVHDFRIRTNMFAELKWSKVSNQKLDAYKELVDIYFDFARRGALWFRATTFDNHLWDHTRFNDGDPDIGISKLYYQMLLHQVVGHYGDLASLYICLDRRLSSTPLEKLHRILNAGAGKEYGLTFGPVRVLVSKDSKKDDILQINDVILGAVSAYKNGRHLQEGAREAKIELAKYVLLQSGLGSYAQDTPQGKTAFAIWNRKPRR